MDTPILVQIIATPVKCAEGYQDRWREVASLVAQQLERAYGSRVQVEYFSLFDVGCPALPPNTQLPLVLIAGDVLSSGGKISVPVIRRRVAEILGLTTPAQTG